MPRNSHLGRALLLIVDDAVSGGSAVSDDPHSHPGPAIRQLRRARGLTMGAPERALRAVDTALLSQIENRCRSSFLVHGVVRLVSVESTISLRVASTDRAARIWPRTCSRCPASRASTCSSASACPVRVQAVCAGVPHRRLRQHRGHRRRDRRHHGGRSAGTHSG